MNWRNTAHHYNRLSIGLHWLTLVLILAVYALIELRENFPKGSDIREGMKTWHFMLGLSILLVTLVRVALQLRNTAPAIKPQPPQWQQLLAKLTHFGLLLLLLAMPILGWLTLSAAGKPIPFYGFEWPALISASKPSASWLKEIHEAGGTLGYVLIGLHAAAALYHHYMVRDNTLLRMLPGRSGR